MAVRKVRVRGRVMWRARVIREGRERSAFCDRKDEASQAEARLLAELRDDGSPPPIADGKVPTLRKFTPEFMEFCASPAASAKGANRPNTLREKERIFALYLLPAFGDRRLDQIGPRDVDRFAARLAAQGLKPNTVGNILITLRRLLRVAHRWGLIPSVPEFTARKVKPDRVEPDAFLDFEETERFLAAASPELHPLLLVAVRTGLRTGELRGLRWCDVQLDDAAGKPRLHVRQTLTKAGFGPPKSGKSRDVPLSWDAAQALRDLPRRGSLVFCQPDGSPLASNALERACKATMRAANLTRVDGSPKALGGHSLRHTWASHCMMQGFPPRVVMAWAGWSSLAMLERYSHLSPEHCTDHIDRLAPRNGLHVVESIPSLTPRPNRRAASAVGTQVGTRSKKRRRKLS